MCNKSHHTKCAQLLIRLDAYTLCVMLLGSWRPPPTLKEGNMTHLQAKHTYTNKFVCVTHMSAHTHVHINIDTDIDIHVHIHIHKYLRIHIHTHLLDRFTRLDPYTMRDMTQFCDLARGSPPHLERLTLLIHT